MKVTNATVLGGVCFLASPHFNSIPVTISGSSLVKAGTPVTAAGAAALNASSAIGLLLYDVDPTVNPNGALLVQGVVDYEKAKANAGITATAAQCRTAMGDIYFRTDCGTAAAFTLSAHTATTGHTSGSNTTTVTLTGYSGTVTVTSSKTSVATVTHSSGTITITGVAAGDCVITVADAVGQVDFIEVTIS